MTGFLSILLMIAGFGMLIFVHELGHFLAARWAGIRTEAFAIGMGPPLLAWRRGVGFAWGSTDTKLRARHGRSAIEMTDEELAHRGIGETEYSLRVLPIGGFVKMLGQDDANPRAVSDDPRSYQRCPVGRRMVVVSAGVVMNILLALALFAVAFLVGVRLDAPIVGRVRPDSPAAQARSDEPGVAPGLRAGDEIVAIDGDPVRAFTDIQAAAAMARPGDELRLEIRRPGAEGPLHFRVEPQRDPLLRMMAIGIEPARSLALAGGADARLVDEYLAETPVFAEGVRAGMTLASVDGVPVGSWGELDAIVRDSGGAALATRWRGEDGAEIAATLPVEPVLDRIPHDEEGEAVEEPGLLGLVPPLRVQSVDPGTRNAGRLEAGDVLLAIGEIPWPRWSQLRAAAAANAGGTLALVVRRDGASVDVAARVSRDGLLEIGVGWADDEAVIAQPIRRTLVRDAEGASSRRPTVAATLDPVPGSRVIAVNGRPVEDWATLRAALRAATTPDASSEIALEVRPPIAGAAPEARTATVAPEEAARLHALGWRTSLDPALFAPLERVVSAEGSPLVAIRMGLLQTRDFVIVTYQTIDRLVRGTVGVEHLRGPVGIVELGAKVLPRGFMYFVMLLGIISVNLAVLNFLPMPIVDGGLFLYLVYEKITGRPPSPAFQNVAMLVGLLIIGSLFVVTFYNDIARLVN